MRYILYARKSSEGDERQVQSIPDQYAVLNRLAIELGLTIVQTIDEARSAKQPGTRPGFARMLELLKSGEADGILCWHLNRLSRNPVDSGTLSWLLQQGVIKMIRTADREYRPDDNVVVMAVENAVSNQFIVDLRRNVQRGQREKALRGWFPHKPPPGYRTDHETREIVPDGERFELIRRAWELMISGAYSVPEVQKRLDKWGFRHRRIGNLGNPINRSGLYTLFDNPFYYGEFKYAGQTYQGKHVPMVSRREFEIVQKVIHKNEPVSQRRPDFPFTGLIRCAECGCLITAERKIKHYRSTNRTVAYCYYHCTRSKGCREPAVKESLIEKTFEKILRSLRLDSRFIDWLEDSKSEFVESARSGYHNVVQDWETRLDRALQRRARLLELRIAGEITAEDFSSLNGSLKTEIDHLTERIRSHGEVLANAPATVSNLSNFLRFALEAFLRGDAKAKREIASCLSRNAILSRGDLQIELHPLLKPFATLEPLDSAPNMVHASPFMPLSPVWQLWMDHVRTLVIEEGVTFPKLLCLQEPEQLDSISDIEPSPPLICKRG